MVINSLSASLQVSAVDVMYDENFGLLLESISCVSGSISKVDVAKSKSSQQINHLTPSKKWVISPEKASRPYDELPSMGLELFYTPCCHGNSGLMIMH